MATSGNGTTQTTQQLETQKLQAVAEAATTEDLITRIEAVLQYMEAIGRELGTAGEADQREIAAFAEGQRADLHAFVRKLVNRLRHRADEVERITGKTEG